MYGRWPTSTAVFRQQCGLVGTLQLTRRLHGSWGGCCPAGLLHLIQDKGSWKVKPVFHLAPKTQYHEYRVDNATWKGTFAHLFHGSFFRWFIFCLCGAGLKQYHTVNIDQVEWLWKKVWYRRMVKEAVHNPPSGASPHPGSPQGNHGATVGQP